LRRADVKYPPFPVPKNGDETKNTKTTRVALDQTCCIGCGQCTNACAFGAMVPNCRIPEIFEAKKAGKKMVAVLAPATRVGISEAMGMPLGSTGEAQLVSALR
jgi:ferredoxin